MAGEANAGALSTDVGALAVAAMAFCILEHWLHWSADAVAWPLTANLNYHRLFWGPMMPCEPHDTDHHAH